MPTLSLNNQGVLKHITSLTEPQLTHLKAVLALWERNPVNSEVLRQWAEAGIFL